LFSANHMVLLLRCLVFFFFCIYFHLILFFYEFWFIWFELSSWTELFVSLSRVEFELKKRSWQTRVEFRADLIFIESSRAESGFDSTRLIFSPSSDDFTKILRIILNYKDKGRWALENPQWHKIQKHLNTNLSHFSSMVQFLSWSLCNLTY
jgi:hypothetical protein